MSESALESQKMPDKPLMPHISRPLVLAVRFCGFDLKHSPDDGGKFILIVKGVICVFLCFVFLMALIATVTLESPPLGILWSDANISLSTIVYALSSGISIASWTRRRFVEKFRSKLTSIRKLRVVQNDKIDIHRSNFLKVGVISILLIGTWTMAALKNVLYYPATSNYNGTMPAEFKVVFWRNLFGAMPFVYVYMGYISTIATAIFWLTHVHVQTELEYFNKEFSHASKSGQLKDPDTFTTFGKRHQDLMALLKYMDKHVGKLVSISGYFSAVALANTLFILATYYNVLTVPYLVLIVFWNIVLLLLVFITIREPGMIHNYVQKTRSILLNDVTLLSTEDKKVMHSYRLFMDRCSNCSSVSIFGAWPIGRYTFDQILLIVPTVTSFMVGIAKLLHL